MLDNPYESSRVECQGGRIHTPLRRLGGTVLAIVGVLLLIALFMPAKREAREAARRSSCINNLKQITLALHNYESAHGMLPPAYTVDEQGNRLHSWRTLILPYMENAINPEIDLTKPWDHPANAAVRASIVDDFVCPSSQAPGTQTTYLALVGPECAFAGAAPRGMGAIRDGTSRTIAVVEVDQGRGVHWMAPHDIGIDEVLQLANSASMPHGNGLSAAFLDGHIESIPRDIEPGDLRAMLTIAGGESEAE